VGKDVQSLFRTFTPIWEREEAERTRRWELFMDSTFCQQCDARVPPAKRRAAQLQGLAAWMSEYRNVPCILDEERCGQVKMLVQAGVPMHLRGELWMLFLGTRRSCVPGHYLEHVLRSLGSGSVPAIVMARLTQPRAKPDSPAAHAQVNEGLESAPGANEGGDESPRTVRSLNSSASALELVNLDHTEPSPLSLQAWGSQIEKDLGRTFPSHPSMDKDGCAALRRVLNAYALHNPTVGYCQGMNFIAGCVLGGVCACVLRSGTSGQLRTARRLLLLFMPEEDAFWGLASVVERLLCGYFNEDMVEAQVRLEPSSQACGTLLPLHLALPASHPNPSHLIRLSKGGPAHVQAPVRPAVPEPRAPPVGCAGRRLVRLLQLVGREGLRGGRVGGRRVGVRGVRWYEVSMTRPTTHTTLHPQPFPHPGTGS